MVNPGAAARSSILRPGRGLARVPSLGERMATTTIVMGLDGTDQGAKVLDHAKGRARILGDCELIICFVIEWSPFTFQTNEENAERHRRREEELATARERVVDPAVARAREEGLSVDGVIRHGNPAEILDAVARERNATEIVVGRSSALTLGERIFGSVSARVAATASVPVTIVP